MFFHNRFDPAFTLTCVHQNKHFFIVKNLMSSNKVSNKVKLRTPASIHGNGMMPVLSE